VTKTGLTVKTTSANLVASATEVALMVVGPETPEEFAVTMDLYSKHINDDLAHPGVWYYHFQYNYDNFGWLVVALFFIGFIISIVRKKYKSIWISIWISVLITFV
jgi:hypothetical protein